MSNTNEQTEPLVITATYSPEDNKLRLYPSERLDIDLYNRVKDAGYKWAPKQGLFVAPMWTPNREDLALELAGFIGDEQTSLEERAEQRAARFEVYQEKRAQDAEQALNNAESIIDDTGGVITSSDNWRQQRKANKLKEKLDRATQHAENMWSTSQYWEHRVRGVIAHAAGRNDTRTLLNRIKKLKAEQRKYKKYIAEKEKAIQMWTSADVWKDKSAVLTKSKALTITNYYDHMSMCFTLDKFPRDASKSQYEGSQSLYSAIEDEIITPEQARDLSIPFKRRYIEHYKRWVNHLELRINYEQAILDASGYIEPAKPKRPAQPPLLNYRAPNGIDMKGRGWNSDVINWPQVEMTKAEYKKVYHEYKFTRTIDGHRVRCAIINDPNDTRTGFNRRLLDVVVFLTDSKEHKQPEAV